MVDILSLPRRTNLRAVSAVKPGTRQSGLPINSLPGWENIPLDSKLPMLKCPGNQVIFSKDKIGKSFKHLKQEFDPYGHGSFPEYNPLHDSNLRTFYANERNLKRLRENGEITQSNEVICNLKDFNAYRLQLHKSHLYYILQELNRLDVEQRDRILIANAEAITRRDHKNLLARQLSFTEIVARRKRCAIERQLRYERMWQKTEEKFQRIAGLREMQKVLVEHKKTLNMIKMQHHWDVANDLQRKRQILMKKLFQFKKDRLQKNLRILAEQRSTKANESQIASWKLRLGERIATQNKMRLLLEEMAKRTKAFIEDHRIRYQEKWDAIQAEIQRRALKAGALKRPKPKHKKPKKPSIKPVEDRHFCPEYQTSFEQLLDEQLCEAINATLDMEADLKIPFNPDDPIYKAAHFIMKHIISKFDTDLNDDKILVKNVSERIMKFFGEAKSFVTFRATQIIAAARSAADNVNQQKACRIIPGELGRETLSKFVSFCKASNTIGTSSYEIHPNMDVMHVSNRRPTPAGSLASIVIDSHEHLVNKIKSEHLCRNEMVFVEHFVIKFKRELIVGVGKRVFGAIECHFQNKIMEIRKELLDIDMNFLVSEVTKSILGYAVNPLNFESSLKLSISALSTDIVWALQQQLLRPKRDPRKIVPSCKCCSCDPNNPNVKLCLYCHEK